MNREEILNTIYSLGLSQGSYYRLYRTLIELKRDEPAQYEEYMSHLEEQNFKDSVDLVLFFEC